MKERIGANAGRVWNVLKEDGQKSVKELKKLTKLTEKEVYGALGWLAREDKLHFHENETDVYVALI
ncbi:MAG: winged helix-turn-helix domain-containing protein [Candidatus Symbiothrix sp.]|jgi:hypothetical protein|nr:winged helix-turn-helix domain-containing protein [Candidatus Symbiothrix sp.]